MTGEKHLLLTVGGRWTDAADAAERWQFGIRCILVFGSVDQKGTLPSDWSVDDDGTTHTVDDWSIETSFKVTQSAATFNPADWFEDQVVPAVAVWAASNSVSSQIKTDFIKVNPVDSAGKVIGLNFCQATSAAGVAGTLGGNLLPLQNTSVVSWNTSRLGAKGRGRIYTPGVTASQIKADGDLTDTTIGNQQTNVAALLEGIALAVGFPGNTHVQPIVTGKPYVNYAVISSLRVGNRVDTQRRRRRQLVETYAKTDLTYP